MKKMRHILTCVLLVLIACSKSDISPSQITSPSTRPNILLIIADDFGLDVSPNYDVGVQKPTMPRLQRLGNEGITFDNFWAFPMCSPTRSSVLTGKYGFRTGVLNASDASIIGNDEKTIQSYLDEQLGKVYSHSVIGKWHLSNNDPFQPTDMGIDYYAGLLGGGVSSYYQWGLVENGIRSQSSNYITTEITNSAINWIGQQDKPWFCWLAYNAPHKPFHLPPENMHSQGVLQSDEASILSNPTPYYLAMIESMDFEIGRLLDSMPAGELEDTIIIFMGDNGTPAEVIQSPYTSNRSKGSIYQGGISVPLIISGKGVSRIGERDSSLINSVDLFSTIGQIAGVDDSNYEDSISFYSLLAQNSSHDREINYSEVLNLSAAKSGYTIRNHEYKLMVFDDGTERIYNLLDDPFELNNLFDDMDDGSREAYELLQMEYDFIRNQ